MPTQSRGFWTCDFCRLSCDTFEEAKEHEVAHCPHRPPPQHRSPLGGVSASSAGPPTGPTPSHPPPPYSAEHHRSSRDPYGAAATPADTPTTAAMGPLSTSLNPEMGDYHHHHHHHHPHHAPPHHHPGGEMQHHPKGGMRCIPMMGPHEVANLTMEDSIACQNIELFEATPEHAAEASRTGGAPVQVGQLALRCMHCSRNPLSAAVYSTVFPASLGSVADSLRLVADQHLSTCGMAPPEIQEACDRAASKRSTRRGDDARNSTEENERSRAALIDYCIGLCQQYGVINKQPSKTGIIFADGEAMASQQHHHHHHHVVETPGPQHGRAPPMHSVDRMVPHSADRMGPPLSVDRMGYPPSGGGPPHAMMGAPGGGNGDPLAPTPLQRRRDRQPTESAERPPMYSAEREGGYPTPYSQGPPPGGEMMYGGGPEGMGAQTPAQPNFESAAGGPEGQGTPHSVHPSEPSPAGFQHLPQYELPTNFPFYQEANRTWHCKFCSHIHPQYRDPQSIWSTPSQGPPPGHFIDHHLSMCRAYHQSIPSPPMYPGPPPPYGPPYGPPQHMPYGAAPGGGAGWEGQTPTHAPPMHPQHLQYSGGPPGSSGENPYPYPSPHMEHPPPVRYGEQSAPGPHYGQSRPPPGGGHPGPHGMPGQPPAPGGPPMERGPAHAPPNGSQQRQESLADSVRHAINYLVASDKDYYNLESRNAKVGKLVLEEDRLLLTDYFFFLMKQLQLCRFSESDRKTRGGKREKITLGYGGLQCVHCADVPNSRKFFWSNVDRLANSFAEIPGHVLKCRRCPQQTKDALMQLKAFHPEQMARLPRGSQKVFFRRMWRRLHDEDPQQSTDQPSPAADKANEENVAPEVKSETETPKVAPPAIRKENSPETGSNSEESAIFLERSTQEAAKALADSMVQPSEPASPSSKILLAIPDDKEWLSDMDCYIRKQLEVFCATDADVATAQSDRKYPVHVGQVGIRCVHCSLTKKGYGAQGTAVAFPFSISGIYESVREFQRLHLDSCENLPEATKAKLAGFKGSSSLSSVLRKYYVLAAKALGLHDTRDGIRSGAESIPLGSQAAFSFADSATHMSDEIRQNVQQSQHHHQPPEGVVGSTFGSVDNRKRKEPSPSQTSSTALPSAKTAKTSAGIKEENGA